MKNSFKALIRKDSRFKFFTKQGTNIQLKNPLVNVYETTVVLIYTFELDV